MDQLFRDASKAGLFQYAGDPAVPARLAGAAGLEVLHIDLGDVHGKRDLLVRIADGLGVPPGFGHNWDALLDALRDLAWLPADGWCILLEGVSHFADAHPADFATLADVLAEAAEFWRAGDKPMWGLLCGPADWHSGWPEWSPRRGLA